MKERIERHMPLIKVFLIYTVIFWIVTKLILYFLPFLIAVFIAAVMKPVYDFMKKRLRFKPSFSATVITLFLFSILLFIIGFLLYLIIREAVGLWNDNKEMLYEYLSRIDWFENLYQMAVSSDTLKRVSSVATSVVRIVPLLITFVIITFVLSVYFLNHLADIKAFISSKLSQENREKFTAVSENSYLTLRRFIRSYMILYGVTFAEAVFIFFLTGTPYPLVFALITAVADVLPVLGPGTVYVPIAVWYFLRGEYLQGITILVFFLITIIVRQILEPKIVSDSVKISPVIVLSAIYFSIVSMNIWVLFYVVILTLLIKILRASEIITSE